MIMIQITQSFVFEKDELLINEHDAQLGDFLERFCSFSNGQWDNGLKWNNAAVWENSNMTCEHI